MAPNTSAITIQRVAQQAWAVDNPLG